jgi:glucokinase
MVIASRQDRTASMQQSGATVGGVLAADIGATHMRAALVHPNGSVLHRRTEPVPRHAEAPAALVELIASTAAEFGQDQVTHAVVGLPGGIDYSAGRLLFAPNLPREWPEQLTEEVLSEQLDGLPVSIANDADLAAVGEAYFGAGRGGTDVAYLTISTGIGAGVLHGGQLLHGQCSGAELGHSVIDWQAWRAGEPATLEELGSGSGLARLARERGLGDLDASGIEAAASEGDERAVEIWQSAVVACAVGVANLVMSFYPDTVVIGGGLGRRPEFFTFVLDEVYARWARHPAGLTIVCSELGDDAGLSGAAAWAEATVAG